MINKELIQEHIALKNKRGFTDKKYDTFFDGKVLQICFYSKGCDNFRKKLINLAVEGVVKNDSKIKCFRGR